MPQLKFPIIPDGLCVDVVVGVDGATTIAQLHSGQPIPLPVRARGAIDTGSNVTAVSLPILQQLGVPRVYRTSTQGVSGSVPVGVYKASVSVTDFGTPGAPWLTESDLLVMDLATPLPGIDVLIGLDILLTCRLTLDGPARQFTLDF